MNILPLVLFIHQDTMTRAVYSNQIKEVFREHRNNKKTLSWIANALNISVNTLKEWSVKMKKWESLEDKRSENGKQKTFSDEDLISYIENNLNATLKDIWNTFWVTDMAILKRLRTLTYSYKKKRWSIENEMKTKEKSFNES